MSDIDAPTPASGAAAPHHDRLNHWVQECIDLCRPDQVHWCDGSATERAALIRAMRAPGSLLPLNEATYPDCWLHRSDPNDVARVEQVTFICSERQEDAGPTNNWLPPAEAMATLTARFDGCMRGRTLYVVPYLMGPYGSPFSRFGIEITDSPYVVLSMGTMTRMGARALAELGADGSFVGGLHSTGDLDPATRMICHFPQTRQIWSFASNYGGNALLGKKCFALRIASTMARDEGWLAEHMLLLEITSPAGERTYVAGAFPSACGKTNLAMLIPPPALAAEGWQVRTVGDDIAWMRPGPDGRLWAVNPEAGFFGVAPGTSDKTNPNAMGTIHRNTIFTNVAVTDDGQPWWEGIGWSLGPQAYLTDWRGRRRPFADRSDVATSHFAEPFAHPNARFTAPAAQCPSISPHWEDGQGVPISAILFGGRRRTAMPLVLQARSWQHGVFLGATMASETTAAAAGATGVLRRDPFAMLPFCGYHMGDYFAHWLEMGRIVPRPPAIFHVNWFRRDEHGSYLWPGYGENLRALIWICQRLDAEGDALNTPIGFVPRLEDIDLRGLGMSPDNLAAALAVDRAEWEMEIAPLRDHLATFGEKLPEALWEELAMLERRLAES